MGMGLGQMGLIPDDQTRQYQYLLANVPSSNASPTSHVTKDTNIIEVVVKNDAKNKMNKEVICGKCKEARHIAKDCKVHV